MGLIYMATYLNKNYVGQHNTEVLETRKKSHFRAYKKFLRDKLILELKRRFNPHLNLPINPKGTCTALYCAFQKYSFSAFNWQILGQNIPDNELNEKEDYYIIKYNALVPNGFNLKLNNTLYSKEYEYKYSEESRKKMSESSIISVRNNLEKYRKKHVELEDIPQFVTYFESGGIRGYRIVNHPNCSFKQFADNVTPVLELKNKILTFLSECEKKPYKTIQQAKIAKGIPKNIIEQKPGAFLVCFTHKGIQYTKFFGLNPNGSKSKKISSDLVSRDINLANAKNWLKQKKPEVMSNNINAK
jgi:hypothetical protein